jgi:hypothetical protein
VGSSRNKLVQPAAPFLERRVVGRSVGMKAIHHAISFADGSTALLEAVRPNTKDGEDVARVLSTAPGLLC